MSRFETLFRPKVLLKVVTGSVLVLGLWGLDALSQQRQTERNPLFARAGLPGDLLVHAQALGARLQLPGRELTVFEGDITDATGTRAIRIVHQLPELLRIETTGRVITFNGDSRGNGLDSVSLNLLESLALDVPEGLFLSSEQGAAVRLLGRRFGPDPRKQPNYSGPRYDIFEAFAPVRTHTDQPLRLKRYYFDSRTGLLLRTRYSDNTRSRPVIVETRFSNWGTADGSIYPGRIERYEGGHVVFSIVLKSVTSGPKQDVGNFRPQ